MIMLQSVRTDCLCVQLIFTKLPAAEKNVVTVKEPKIKVYEFYPAGLTAGVLVGGWGGEASFHLSRS